MTQIVSHRNAGERGRLYARHQQPARDSAPAMAEDQALNDTQRLARAEAALLLDRLGPAYAADADHRLIYCNDAFRTFARDAWGADAEPLANGGSVAPEALRLVFNALAATGHFEPSRTEVTRSGVNRLYQGRHYCQAGRNGEQGGPLYFGWFEDITRESALEARLAAVEGKLNHVISATSDWFWETDAALNLSEISPRVAALTGEPPEALLGRPLLALGEVPPPPSGVPTIAQELSQRRPFRNRLLKMQDDAGQARRIHLSGSPYFDKETGRFLGYRGTGTDVTRTLEAERAITDARRDLERTLDALELRNEQLRETLAKAQAASDAKTDFLALTSHELRTPLNAIIGFAELCRRGIAGPVGEQMGDYLSNILSAANHLVQIIDNLLDTVRIENETLDIDLRELPIDTLVRDCMKMVEMRAQTANIVLVAPDPGIVVSALADETAVRQILINLLTNAIKFTPKGRTVGVEIGNAEGDRIAITVWDTGIGIPEDRRQAVFERFHRVRSSAIATTEGVGIGLHVSRGLAQLMGGDILLDSELEQGSRFTLLLRRWNPAQQDAD